MESQEQESVYTSVRYKKQQGSLVLSSSSLTFHSNEMQSQSWPWRAIIKHQVSPASHHKALVKIILSENGSSNNYITFQMGNRTDLDRVRKEISQRLHHLSHSSNASTATGTKRSLAATAFEEMDPAALAVTRSTLLASHPTLRQQHTQLVRDTQTLTEEEFWETHRHLLEEEYARISGLAKAGTSSVLQSYLPTSGKVTLGVEEMRQIFILYPAVHRAYEEKVPLELSDEQFWRKYLESEYFHRDRGRMGTAALNHSGGGSDKKSKMSGPTIEEQDARAAVVGTDDMFSRYHQKLQEESADNSTQAQRKWGTRLAIGQFDLAKTYETERSKVLEGPRDYHPPNQADDGKGARIIQKYNRHWAMVLHPDEAIAGSNLMEVARRSVEQVLPDDDDAKYLGGFDEEMVRLVDFASAAEEEANHALNTGVHDEYEQLNLKNVEVYYTGQLKRQRISNEADEEARKRHTLFSKAMAAKVKSVVHSLPSDQMTRLAPDKALPEPGLGRELLSALTKKMAQDSRTEAASLELVKNLPEDFRKKLHSYFRRSSELLRHFFALRRLGANNGGTQAEKLSRIVRGMETFYREMEGVRREFPQTETGEMMRKMCLPIMDQLDWAFKLHREGSGGGGGGGFVAVEAL